MAKEAGQEWTGVEFEGPSIWHTRGGAYSLARGGDVHILEERCAAAAVTDSGAKATQLGRVMMELVWGLKRVFKREVWNRCECSEDVGDMDDEGPSVMVVRRTSFQQIQK